ncbi:MAG: carbamoyltransferase C-terminal domain-containing protein, partial [Gammaproteobacteria bacterium]|nr:carbamoyltransferase C-terminal domain-containing protein [Gammaproteobacteria bacterium]
FVCPPMGDEGLPVGNCIAGIAASRGLAAVPRRRLADAYLGRPYSGSELLAEARAGGFAVETPEGVAEAAAGLLADGRIGAIFAKSMEMGPRALGGRSILASPADRGLNDTLNERLERTEFMPFAPYVLDEDARRVFDIDDRNWEACRFMTITTGVKETFRPVMPAVVHVDHTARPQIIERETNPLYYDILRAFRDRTGIPCLVNTSFNAHEEPIINTPAEALRALADGRVDFLVCDAGLVFPGNDAS